MFVDFFYFFSVCFLLFSNFLAEFRGPGGCAKVREEDSCHVSNFRQKRMVGFLVLTKNPGGGIFFSVYGTDRQKEQITDRQDKY